MLEKQFQNVLKNPKMYKVSMTLDNTSEPPLAFLNFNQDAEFKSYELLSLEFNETEEEEVKRHVNFRLNSHFQKQ